jgi:hypothetical protein
LERLRREVHASVLHHGDCVGGDDDAAMVAEQLGYRIVAHPPTSDKYRAFHQSHETRRPAGYLERDRVIVAASAIVIGCPFESVEQPRGGTWYTIRYARMLHSRVLVIGPDGVTR